MQTVITGGAGFIGSHLAELLLERGDRVTLIDDLSTGNARNIRHIVDHPGCRLIVSSIRDNALIERQIEAADRVFHLAAAVGVQLIVERPVHTIETNIAGSEVVLNACAKYNKPVLITSTSEVYGKGTKVPFAEDDDVVYGNTTKRRWSYAVSKAVDEFLALAYNEQYGLPVVIVRLFNCVGPRQTGRYGMVIPRFVEQALAGRKLQVYGDGQQSRCFGHVADVVPALVKLIETRAAHGEVVNIGNDEVVTIEQLARRVIDLVGQGGEIEHIPYAVAYEAGFEDMRVRQPSLVKAHRLIGYRPTRKLDDILRDVIAEVRSRQQPAQHA